MTRKLLTTIILIAFFVGALGSIFFTHFVFPPLSTVRGFGWLRSLVSTAPIVINRTQEVQFTEGVDLTGLVKQVGNVTVGIYDAKNNFLGNGIVATADGLIMTTLTVLQNQTQVSVMTNDGQRFAATVKLADPKGPIVLLAISATGLNVAQFDDASSLKPGQRVVFVGRSNVKFENKILVAFVSQSLANEVGEKQVSTNTTASADYYGGPIVNLSGRVVGLMTGNNENVIAENLKTLLSNYLSQTK